MVRWESVYDWEANVVTNVLVRTDYRVTWLQQIDNGSTVKVTRRVQNEKEAIKLHRKHPGADWYVECAYLTRLDWNDEDVTSFDPTEIDFDELDLDDEA